MTKENKPSTVLRSSVRSPKTPNTTIRDLISGLGFNTSPALGTAVTSLGGGVLGLALSSILGSHRGKGFALGALGGLGAGIAASPLSKSVAYKRASLGNSSSFNSAVLRTNLNNFVANKNSFDFRAQKALSDALKDAARLRSVRDLTSTRPSGIVQTGDVARAGINAGLSTLSAQTLGHVLGARNPVGWQGPGAVLGGAFSLGRSTGFIQ